MRPLLTCLLLTLSLSATAQIYSYTDANGNTVYTNQPPQGSNAQSVDLPPTNSIAAQPPSVVSNPSDNTTGAPPYSVLQLINLPTEEALRANNGTFSVDVSIVPSLAPGQLLQLVLDGQPYGAPSSAPPLQLTDIDRGEHSLAVQVLSAGQAIQQSASISFTVQRVALGTPKATPR